MFVQLKDLKNCYITLIVLLWSNLTAVICLHTVKWLNSFIWPINGIQTDATTPDQNGTGGNTNEEVLHIPQSPRIGASPSDCFVSYTRTLGVVDGDAVSVFYNPSRLARFS